MNKVNIEEIKRYKNAISSGSMICYVCGAVDPECGFSPLIQANVPREEISSDMCKDCYRKMWKNAEKADISPESIWGLK